MPRGPHRSRQVLVGVVLAAAFAVTAASCGHADRPDLGEDAAPTTTTVAPTTTTAPDHTTTVVTTPATSVEVFSAPDDPAPALTVEKPGPGLQAPADPLAFVVEDEQDGWVQVQVPVRPNGTTGWIKADGLQEATTDLRIEVSLSWFRLKMFDGDELLLDVPVAIGADDSPTPTGTFFTTTLMQGYAQPSAYGIAAIGLSGFSEVLESFGGGPPQIAIHGTYDDAAIGSRVSNGCIRMSNADIQSLVDQLPQHLGVPVTIAP
ncbi:MAG: L,D-transpeptidase [Acidimicrobiales bacterium]|nr:L,D-transpeptidase [Acidimicrobiales bacterium]